MRLSDFQWIRSRNSVFGLCLYLVLLGLIVVGAAESIMPNDVYSAQSPTAGAPPVIQVFKANPMTLETPTSAAVYTFKVKRATNLIITEAGNEIRNISNPTGAALSGIATGLPASAIPADDSGKFKAVLMASNAAGAVKAELTLSFSDKLLASGQPAETEGADNETDSRSPKWLDQYFSPFGPARSSQSGTEPQFFDCPSDCDHCLTPEDAKSQGMGERCSAERCYYSPDNQQNWYCFKPAPGWCCNNLNVSEATKDECNQMGGSWFLNQSEAQERCQPLGYCCQNGNITSLTRSQCAQAGGTYYADVVEAKERCQPLGYCCQNGQVYSQTTQSQCTQVGGAWYTNQAQAMERCQPMGYCCSNGKVGQTTQAQCAQVGGAWYTNQAQAIQACQPMGYCCAGGQVGQTTQSQCAQVGGTYYTNQGQAIESCRQAATCWCCAGGKVYQTTQAQCAQAGGNCYDSQSQATAGCRQVAMCWCCSGGKVSYTTQAACAQVGGACYSTQTEATRACQPPIRTPYLK
jgi:hypothetical protein